MSKYIGRPYNDSKGAIREVLINYHPSTHYTIDQTIAAMPHVHFLLFEGWNQEEYTEEMEKKGVEILRAGSNTYFDQWKAIADNHGSVSDFLSLYPDWIKRASMYEIQSQTDDPDYIAVKSVLELAALFHGASNFRHESAIGLYADQIVSKYPDRVTYVKVDYHLQHFARDTITALHNNGSRIIIPASPGMTDDEIMLQLGDGSYEQADEPIWNERGYEVHSGLDIKSIVGGQIVANADTVFVGMNSFEESIFFRGKSESDEELQRIIGELNLVSYRVPNIYEHVDVFLSPITDEDILISDPEETMKLLDDRRLLTPEDRELTTGYVYFCNELKADMHRRKLNPVSVPFLISPDSTFSTMFSYANVLHEDDTLYAPKRGAKNVSERLREIGAVLDDSFLETASRFKHVVPVRGFDLADSWRNAGLRCMANVIWRE